MHPDPAELRQWARADSRLGRIAGDLVHRAWDEVCRVATIRAQSARAKRFGRFGARSAIAFPYTSLVGERWIWIGDDVLIAPNVALSAGIRRGQQPYRYPVVRIGDRCVIGRGSGIVGHWQIDIGDDVWTGHHVYITDQNHGYEDLTIPIGRQAQEVEPVRIGSGSWLGHGSVVLPGVTIGEHVVVAANSVVTKDLPDRCVAAGSPARVVRQFVDGEWVRG